MSENKKKTSLDPALLSILVCPKSKKELRYDEQNQELVCDHSKLAYRIENGVPIMLVEEARKID